MEMFISSSFDKWKDDKPTQSQLEYIRHILEESGIPLPPFEGKTKGEAAEWIEKNRHRASHNPLNYDEG